MMIRRVIEMLAGQKSKEVVVEPKSPTENANHSVIQDQNIMFLSRRIRISYIVSEHEKNKKR